MNDSRAGALFAAGVATSLTIIYWMARWGLVGDSPLLIGQVLGVAWFLLLLPPALAASSRLRGSEDRQTWYLAQPALALLALAVLVLAGFVANGTGIPFAAVVALCGAGLAVWTLSGVASSVREHPLAWLAALAGTAVLSILIAGQVWAAGYLNPLLLEKVALGTAHRDVLYHASISSMIRTYGIPSTGLDGVPILRYHFGSHWLIAWLSALVRVSPLDFYQLGYPVILVPFFLQSLLGFAASVSDRVFGRPLRLFSRTGIAVWLVLGVSFASALPLAMENRVTRVAGMLHPSDGAIVVSESYLVGMALFFLTAWLLVGRFAGRSNPALVAGDKVLLVLILPALLASIGFAKVSILVLSAALLLYLWLRFRLYRDGYMLAAAGVCAVVAGATFAMVSPSGGSSSGGLSFLPYVRDLVVRDASGAAAVALVVWFMIAHFFWSWLYALLRLHQLGVTSLARLREVWRDKLALDVEAVAVICVIGAVPGMFLAIAGGSAYYFSGVQQWLSVGLLMGMIPSLAAFRRTQSSSARVAVSPARVVWSVAAACVLGVAISASALFHGGRLVRSQAATRAEILAAGGESTPPITRLLLSGLRGGNLAPAWSAISLRLRAPQSALDRNPRYRLLLQLRNVASASASEKRRTAVFIPRIDTTYWGMLPDYRAAFVAPAMTQVAAVDGLPEEAPPDLTYGFSAYTGRPMALSLDEATSRAARLGFDRLIVFDGRQSEGTMVHLREPQ